MNDKVYVVFTNTDLTEGRGRQVPLYVCELYTTAVRMSKKKGVTGSDAEVHEVHEVTCKNIDGRLYMPVDCVDVFLPTREDIVEDDKRIRREQAIQKATALGLSKEDIEALK